MLNASLRAIIEVAERGETQPMTRENTEGLLDYPYGPPAVPCSLSNSSIAASEYR